MYEQARQSRLQNFTKVGITGKIFLKAYNVINDFSGIVFFKKIFIPHIDVFFSLELPPPDTLEFVQSGHEWVLGVQ